MIQRYREELQVRHDARRTVKSSVLWLRRFLRFHGLRHPREMGSAEVNAFLSDLAVALQVSASTQNQALAALLFLYRELLHQDLELEGTPSLVVGLLYGSGLRLMEALRLRVKDVDVARREVLVRDGKGGKDRVTLLPQSLIAGLQCHLETVKRLHQRDLEAGWGRVVLPGALARKNLRADREWAWQWVFPQARRWRDPANGHEGRHHVDSSVIQKAVKQAMAAAGVSKAASCHTFRHSFATHLLEGGPGHPHDPGVAGTP